MKSSVVLQNIIRLLTKPNNNNCEHFTRDLKIQGLYFLFAVCSVFIAANNHLAIGSNCNMVFICYKETVVPSNNS